MKTLSSPYETDFCEHQGESTLNFHASLQSPVFQARIVAIENTTRKGLSEDTLGRGLPVPCLLPRKKKNDYTFKGCREVVRSHLSTGFPMMPSRLFHNSY